jgi:hypothetical protein
VELSPEVALPAQIDLPIPAAVGIPHAVAKRGPDGKLYLAAATREVDGEWAVMKVTTDRPSLQLEYYAPISTSADVRNFTYQWRGGLEITSFNYEVLPPVFAVNLVVTPAPSGQAMIDLGVPLQTGELGARTAAQQETITVTYSNPSGRVSVTPAPPPAASGSPPLLSSSSTPPAQGISTTQLAIIVAGIAAIVIAGLWFASRKRDVGDS